MSWWRFTRLALEALTEPKTDVVACDRAMEQLARESRLGAALHRASWTIRSAWRDSRARTATAAVRIPLAPVRARGWIVAVAGATALGLNAVKPMSAGPLSWMVPSLVVAAGVLIMLAAGPLSRALSHRNS
jgi:hypothetical protein